MTRHCIETGVISLNDNKVHFVYTLPLVWSKDYSDIKEYSKPFSFDTKIYANISQLRSTDVDMFYMSLSNTSSLEITTSGTLNISYEIHNFDDDTNRVTSFLDNLI